MIYPDLDYCMYYFCSALKSLFVKTNGGGGGNQGKARNKLLEASVVNQRQ